MICESYLKDCGTSSSKLEEILKYFAARRRSGSRLDKVKENHGGT
jgi:hypothetical protein